jgi:hypothetical protein
MNKTKKTEIKEEIEELTDFLSHKLNKFDSLLNYAMDELPDIRDIFDRLTYLKKHLTKNQSNSIEEIRKSVNASIEEIGAIDLIEK